MRSLQLVCTAIEMPLAGWNHAAVRGTERDFVGNVVPPEMIKAEQRLAGLSDIHNQAVGVVGLVRVFATEVRGKSRKNAPDGSKQADPQKAGAGSDLTGPNPELPSHH